LQELTSTFSRTPEIHCAAENYVDVLQKSLLASINIEKTDLSGSSKKIPSVLVVKAQWK
jgi:hypothetical protein